MMVCPLSSKGQNRPMSPPAPAPIAHYENFPVASWLCPPRLRAPIAAIYHFARTADDLADEGTQSAAERLRDLQAYRQELARLASPPTTDTTARSLAPDPRWAPLFAALSHAVQQHRLPLNLLHDLLDAFTQDVEKPEMARAMPTMRSCLTIAAVRPTRSGACCCTCMACTTPRRWPKAMPFAPPCN